MALPLALFTLRLGMTLPGSVIDIAILIVFCECESDHSSFDHGWVEVAKDSKVGLFKKIKGYYIKREEISWSWQQGDNTPLSWTRHNKPRFAPATTKSAGSRSREMLSPAPRPTQTQTTGASEETSKLCKSPQRSGKTFQRRIRQSRTCIASYLQVL